LDTNEKNTHSNGNFAENAFWDWFFQLFHKLLQTRRHQLHAYPHLILCTPHTMYLITISTFCLFHPRQTLSKKPEQNPPMSNVDIISLTKSQTSTWTVNGWDNFFTKYCIIGSCFESYICMLAHKKEKMHS